MGRSGRDSRPSSNRTDDWIYAEGPARPQNLGTFVGKWMPRVGAADVDDVWAKVAEATRAGELGISAKVSTALNNPSNPRGAGPRTHVICVYTRDCRDLRDVGRVLAGLRRLGLGARMSYKEDGATYAGIYGRGASLYVAQAGSMSVERRRAPIPAPLDR